MIEVNFINNYAAQFDDYNDIYQEVAAVCMDVLNKNAAYEISVTLVNNDFIQKMNKEYRHKDYATDVISFENNNTFVPDDEYFDLGDVVISVDKARAQADEYQHSLKRELIFLFVHGLLHCCGYDHLDEITEKEMFAIQGAIMNEVKNKISF